MIDLAAEHQERTGRASCCGARPSCSAHPRYMAGAATNPDPEVFAYGAAQVAHCMNATHRLGGHNYVLWGGREGYETLLNTDMKRELDQLGRFLNMVVEHKHAIGFEGAILLEPKPFEPTKHQYDYDVAARARLPAEVRPRARGQGQHRGQPRHPRRPRLRPRDRRRRCRRNLRIDRRQRRRRPPGLGPRPLPGVGRADDARDARDPAGRRLDDRRAQLRRQAASPVDVPRRSVPRPHRRHGHDGAFTAGGSEHHRIRRARSVPRRPLCRLGRAARHQHSRRRSLAGRVARAGVRRRRTASRARAARRCSRTWSPGTSNWRSNAARARRRFVDAVDQGRST